MDFPHFCSVCILCLRSQGAPGPTGADLLILCEGGFEGSRAHEICFVPELLALTLETSRHMHYHATTKDRCASESQTVSGSLHASCSILVHTSDKRSAQVSQTAAS